MALARTNLLGAISGAAGSFGTGAYTTGSFTPPDGSMLVIGVEVIENGGTGDAFTDLTITDSLGVPLTYTTVISQAADTTFVTSLRIYRAFVTTGVSMTLTFDTGARSIGVYAVSVVAYTGHDAGSPIGATAQQSQVGGFAGPPTPATMNLSGAPAATSEVYAVMAMDKAVAGVTPGATYTEIHEVHNTDWGGIESEVRTGSTSVTVDWVDLRTGGGALFNYAAAAIEIKAAPDAPVGGQSVQSLPLPLMLMFVAASQTTATGAIDTPTINDTTYAAAGFAARATATKSVNATATASVGFMARAAGTKATTSTATSSVAVTARATEAKTAAGTARSMAGFAPRTVATKGALSTTAAMAGFAARATDVKGALATTRALAGFGAYAAVTPRGTLTYAAVAVMARAAATKGTQATARAAFGVQARAGAAGTHLPTTRALVGAAPRAAATTARQGTARVLMAVSVRAGAVKAAAGITARSMAGVVVSITVTAPFTALLVGVEGSAYVSGFDSGTASTGNVE